MRYARALSFSEKLRKVEDARVEGYLRIIERLDLEIHEASKMICNEASNDERPGS